MIERADILELEPASERPTVTRTDLVVGNATPSDLLRIAINSGADLDRLERLMAMQVAYEEREAKKLYNIAFAAFKAEAVVIIKKKTVDQGPLAGKKYAELYTVVDAVTPALSKHGLSTAWRLTKDDKDWLEVTCTLKHDAGYSESVSMGGPPDSGGAKSALQARASTKTFLERYTLKAILGVAEQGDDNDGADDLMTDELKAFGEASMKGTAALRAHYDAHIPTESFWRKNAAALKEAAAKADKVAK